MHDDLFNPKSTLRSTVFLDELDALGRLPLDRLDNHITAAIDTLPGEPNVVRDLLVEHLEPVIGPGTLRIDVWVERLDDTSCVYGFLCSSPDGNTPYARGERSVMNVERNTWSESFRQKQSALLKELPAFA